MSVFQGNTKKEEDIVRHAAQTDDSLCCLLNQSQRS